MTAQDLDRSVQAYCEAFGYRVLAGGEVSAELAAYLGAPLAERRRWALLGCRDDRAGLVRIVESPLAASATPLRQLGWAALEIAVQDADELEATLDPALFRVLGRPKPLGSTGGALRALQVAGPGNEVLYLTERLRDLDGFDLPVPKAPVDRVFIAVLATHELEQVRAFFELECGGSRASDHPVAIGVVNRSFDLDPATTHRLSSVQLDGQSLVEIDEYPPAAPAGAVPAGELPPGVALVTFAADSVPDSVDCSHHHEAPYDGRPSWCTRLVTGELVEFIA